MELFKKIFIKNSEDLPKDDKPYICHVKTSNDTGHLSWMPVKGNEGIWEMVDWYHQPTEIKFPDTLDKVNAERAYPMKKYPYTNVSDLMLHADKINTAGEGFRDGIDWTISWMRENNNLKDENSL